MNKLCLLALCFSFLTMEPLFVSAQSDDTTHGIKWTTGLSWEQVKQKAAAENKYIFLDCYATWCGPCKDMDKRIYVNDSVGEYFNKHFISVKLQMDKTEKDDEHVKNWYDDASAIGKQYDIQGFPSFIFLNPRGVTTDLQTGYKNVKEFVSIAKTAMQPGVTYNNITLDNYYSLVVEYRKGNINYKELPSMIRFATRLDTAFRAELMKDHKEYVMALPPKKRYNKENIQFWSSLNLGLSSPLFKFFLNDGERIDKVMGIKGYAADIIDKTIRAQIVAPFFVEQNTRKEIPMSGMILSGPGLQPDSSEAAWKKLQQLISKQFNNKTAKRNVLAAKVDWFARHFNFYMYCKFRLVQLNKYKVHLSNDFINATAWNAFVHLTDKKILAGYVKWMGKVVEARPAIGPWMDTYANLLYKIGRKEDAIFWEEKALQVGDIYEKDFRETLGQMKRGEPTNINEAVWEGINTVTWNGLKFSKYVMIKDNHGNPIEKISILNNRSGESKLTTNKGWVKLEVLLGDKLTISNEKYERQEIEINKDPGVFQVILKPIQKIF